MRRSMRAVASGGAAALMASLLLPLAAGPSAAAEDPWVVAIGDSYMSGEGGVYTNKHTAVPQDGDENPPEWTWTRDSMGGLPAVYFDNADGSGEQIPFCHRSPFSPGYLEGYQTLNLACSGAEAVSKISGSGAKALPKPGVDFAELNWNGQAIKGQAAQLQEFAKDHDVKVITLSIGGNDFGFADLATLLLLGGTVSFGQQPVTFAAMVDDHPNASAYKKWSGEEIVQSTAARVQSAVKNVQQAMANAGKSPDSYKIVYQSTPRPVPDGPDFNPQETAELLDLILDDAGIKSRIGGCPIWGKDDGATVWGPFVEADLANYPGDAEWVYETVFPNLIRAQRTGVEAAVAEMGADGPQVVFNDVSDSFQGNELCGKDIVRVPNYTPTQFSWPDNPPVFGPGQGLDTEWINAVGFYEGLAGGTALSELADNDPRQLTQVLHPNFWGQRALAACNQLAADSSFSYVKCERDTSGLADDAGRPLMRAGTPSEFVSMPPMRALDTRASSPARQAGPVTAGASVVVDLNGKIPAGATAVAFNVTVTDQSSSGFAEVAPAGSASGTSTVNWTAPLQTIANGHITKINGGQLQVSVGGTGTAHLILDITGAFVPVGSDAEAGSLTGVERRVYDSREGDGPLAPGASRTLNINDDVRAMAESPTPTAAAVNVTVTGTKGSGVLSVAKEATSSTSTINWSGVNQTIANAVITDVADDGTFVVTNSGKSPAEVIVDLTGVFTPGGAGAKFHPGDPTRSYDSRVADRPLTDTRSRLTTQPVPTDAVAIAVNTTITGNEGSGYLAVTHPATVLPLTSTVNWYEGQTTRANGTITGVGAADSRAHVGGSFWTHYIHDVSGYFK